VFCRAVGIKDKKSGVQEEFSIDYDYLVIGMGGRSNTFNTPGVEEHAHFLKVYISFKHPIAFVIILQSPSRCFTKVIFVYKFLSYEKLLHGLRLSCS